MQWARRATTVATVTAAVGALTARPAFGQTPTPQPGSSRDSVRTDSIRRAVVDSIRRAVTDSTARDSIVARQLRAIARRPQRSFFDQIGLDRLRLTEIGIGGGVAFPDQVRSTPLYTIHADYGEIVPNFRVVFGAAYWTSRYTDDAVSGFSQALGNAVANAGGGPAGRDSVHVGEVRSSDVALTAETRWRPGFLGGRRAAGVLRPWVALGASAHFINVQNPTLDGTFVERALDGVAFGPTGAFGIDLVPLRVIMLTAEARYDLFNGARYGSFRVGGSYVFEQRRLQ